MELYVFPGPAYTNKTPLDYAETPDGKRLNVTVSPSGVIKHSLVFGIEEAILPPLAVWDKGRYFGELTDDGQEALKPFLVDPEKDIFQTYVVTGEYTPGNYIARMYLLPRVIAENPDPPHPLLWTEVQKRGRAVTSYGIPNKTESSAGGWRGGTSGGTPFHQPTPTPAATTQVKTTVAKVPAKVRVRCPGCGHWWKMDDLPVHVEYCCPGVNGPDSDWAFQCECCDTLDEVQTPKTGFPRPKPKAKPAAKKEPEKPKEPAAAEEETEVEGEEAESAPQETQDA